jgi:AdoMet-dependent heme synthase
VTALAGEIGAGFSVDPTITPMMDGDRSILALNIAHSNLEQVFRDTDVVDDVNEFCAPPEGPFDAKDAFDRIPCSAGHSSCYISPYGDVYACVQFPLPSGNIRTTSFSTSGRDRRSSPKSARFRSPICTAARRAPISPAASRCPGLAYMEGDMRGPSTQDCEKSYARFGVKSENLRARQQSGVIPLTLVVPRASLFAASVKSDPLKADRLKAGGIKPGAWD